MDSFVQTIYNQHIWETDAWKALKEEVPKINQTHLKELLKDETRFDQFSAEFDNIILDYTRQRVTPEIMEKLFALAREAKLEEKIQAMTSGKKINITENRAVLHTALRATKDQSIIVDGEDVVPKVHETLNNIKIFSDKIRNGELKGVTGKNLTTVVSIGIGGSYLGPEFVFEALRADKEASVAAKGRTLKFLANVDPVDTWRCFETLDAEHTLIVIVSKTFTTAETMLNAKTARDWILKNLKHTGASDADIIAKHLCAVSTNIPLCNNFGIKSENIFGFWDWVGGRYSVCSAVGMLPLSLQYGYEIMSQFLSGAHAIDVHFATTPMNKNIPVLMGLLGVWNSSFLEYPTRALLPYAQSLLRFPAHIQQVDMESNGKRITMDGTVLPFAAGEVDFGEPGTNGQHSFYQLIHQGRVIPADFIGFKQSQQPVSIEGEPVCNHDELMSNFFAQPDALACGKTQQDLEKEGVKPELFAHKIFSGNRPSSSILFNELNAYTCGELLSIYEHRTAVEGFIWNICSFDQWGVELGKVLAKQVRSQFQKTRTSGAEVSGFNPCTTALMNKYLH
ncbi:hypothetical protein WA158_000077 [Blastocystis sp. Blastoise]